MFFCAAPVMWTARLGVHVIAGDALPWPAPEMLPPVHESAPGPASVPPVAPTLAFAPAPNCSVAPAPTVVVPVIVTGVVPVP